MALVAMARAVGKAEQASAARLWLYMLSNIAETLSMLLSFPKIFRNTALGKILTDSTLLNSAS